MSFSAKLFELKIDRILLGWLEKYCVCRMTLIGILCSQKAMFEKHRSGLYLIGFISFVAIGAEIFILLEGQTFKKSQQDVIDAKTRILNKYENVTAEVLNAFLDEMRDAGIRGLPIKNDTVAEWSYSSSVFFVSTLLTTVGYGHFAPKTILGKLFCMVFTAMGIPITLIQLAYYVDKLLKASENYKSFLFRKCKDKFGTFFIRLFHVSSLMFCIVVVCFVLPAFVFIRYEEGWSLFDAIYFCFISLTTVGLGDLVPAMNPYMDNTDLYKLCASLYLIVGVTVIMFMMAMCGDFLRNYRNDYDRLPFTISTEKIPINPGSVLTYGSIIIPSEKNGTSGRI